MFWSVLVLSHKRLYRIHSPAIMIMTPTMTTSHQQASAMDDAIFDHVVDDDNGNDDDHLDSSWCRVIGIIVDGIVVNIACIRITSS